MFFAIRLVLPGIFLSFQMHSLLVPFLVVLCTTICASNLPIGNYTVANLGFVTDVTFNVEGIFHDGGGGATQNGYHVQVFADSGTTSDGFNFVHNSVAYYGLVRFPIYLFIVM